MLFVSGYASREAVELSLTTRNASFLAKPFTPEKLARKVRERLDRPAIPRPAADPARRLTTKITKITEDHKGSFVVFVVFVILVLARGAVEQGRRLIPRRVRAPE